MEIVIGQTYEHLSTGRVYQIICEANKGLMPGWVHTVVYRGVINGTVYARPYEEFQIKMRRY
jgi:hypothetical protein